MTLDLFPDFACQRIFLGWDRPLIQSAAEFVCDRYRSNTSLDLSNWMCVVPTAQTSHTWSQRLTDTATSQGLEIVPPKIITAGELAEQLYEPALPIAIEFEQTLAWARVLSSADSDSLRPLLPVLPETDSLGPWLEIGGTLRRLQADLASGNLRFNDVIEHCDTDAERHRWALLDKLFQKYLSQLKSAGLSDHHVGRSDAVKKRTVNCSRNVMLVGTSDLNESIASLLNELQCEVISFVAAPESKKSSFDSLGRFKTDAFTNLALPMKDEYLVSAGDITDQAGLASDLVSQFSDQHAPSRIALGVTDDSQIAPLEVQLEGCGTPSYRHIGWTISATSVGRLLDLVSQLIARPTWRSLAAFVRHADVHRSITETLAKQTKSSSENANGDVLVADRDILVDLDQLLANHLPVYLDADLPAQAVQRCGRAIQIRDCVNDWLSDFLSPAKQARTQPIAIWCGQILKWLDTIYEAIEEDSKGAAQRHLTVVSIAKVRELLERFSTLNERLDVPINASSAFEMIVGRLAELRVGQERQPDDIPIHGWLDLALDDSDAMIVCGLNHPYVPAAVTSDPFLPGSLRSRLRLSDNERRYARDVYAMQLILSSRKDIRFIVGKKAADGSPTPPSRLLAAASADDLARRIRFLLDQERPSAKSSHAWDNQVETTELPIPVVSVVDCPVTAMSVTAFKSYLDCPFRFYLRYVLNLKPIDDQARELAANQFGDLVHGAVEYFGQSDRKDETDEKDIFDALKQFLHQYADENFGDGVQSSVMLQIRQAERRLRFVAKEQAARIGQGWKIHWTEKPIRESDNATVTIDGKSMYLKGRFDRIDRNEITGQWAILDYKTHGHKPEKKHLKKNSETGELEWIDLQLPLYRMMIPHLGIESPPEEVQLGYFNVSDKEDETKINVADFSEPLMDEANRIIHDCVRRIFACDFRPTEDRVQYDDYEMILQTGVASRLMEQFTESEVGVAP